MVHQPRGRDSRHIGLALAILACAMCSAEDVASWPKIEALPVVSPQNASRLRLVGQIGSPQVEEMAWSYDGRYLGLRSSDGVTIYGLETEKKLRLTKVRVLAGDRTPLSFSFSKNEEAIATCDGGPEITLWDIRSGWVRGGLKDTGAEVKAVAFGTVGELFAAATTDGKLRLWRDRLLEKPPQILEDHENGAAGISMDPKGKWAVTWAGWNDVNVWDLTTGERVTEISTKTPTSAGVLAPAFVGSDGTLWANAPGKTLRWQLPSGDPLPQFPVRLCLGPGCFHPDGSRGLAYTHKGIGVAALKNGEVLRAVADYERYSIGSFDPMKGKLAVSVDGQLSLMDAGSGTLLFSESRLEASRLIGVSGDRGWLLCGTQNSNLELVDVHKNGKPRNVSLSAHVVPSDAILDSKGRLLITRSYSPETKTGDITSWRLSGSQFKRSAVLDTGKDWLRSMALSPKADVVAIGTSEPLQVKFVVSETGKVKGVVAIPSGARQGISILDLAFHPGGKLLAVVLSQGKEVLLLDSQKSAVAFTLPLPDKADPLVTNLCFNTAGTLLAVLSIVGEVFVYDVAARRLQATIALNTKLAKCMDISPDSKLLACASSRNMGFRYASDVIVVDLDSGSRLCQIPAHTTAVSALYFIHGGKVLASSSYDGSIRFWAVGEATPKNPKDKSK